MVQHLFHQLNKLVSITVILGCALGFVVTSSADTLQPRTLSQDRKYFSSLLDIILNENKNHLSALNDRNASVLICVGYFNSNGYRLSIHRGSVVPLVFNDSLDLLKTAPGVLDGPEFLNFNNIFDISKCDKKFITGLFNQERSKGAIFFDIVFVAMEEHPYDISIDYHEECYLVKLQACRGFVAEISHWDGDENYQISRLGMWGLIGRSPGEKYEAVIMSRENVN